METANPASFHYMTRIFSDAFSDRSAEFAPPRPIPDADTSDDLVGTIISDLTSTSIDAQRRAAMEIRLLAKHCPDNRLRLARAGVAHPLVAMISSPDPELQEHAVTAVHNLSLHSDNTATIAAAGAIRPLARAVASGRTVAARENAACALTRLARAGAEHRAAIGRSGAIPALVGLLSTAGAARGGKDAATALYVICGGRERENAARAVEAGVVRVLLEMMADPGSGMVDKAAYVLAAVVAEGKSEVVEEGGVAVLVEMLEVGTQRQKEVAAEVLLEICEESSVNRTMVAREGAIPPLVALSQCASSKSKKKAEALIELLRRPRGQI